ncbi:hypothetical protein H6F98_13980 [Microcoleus sp. FACHB-SPT15]|nr:hypothetical protein [Microcoleus sp. FACHB-SPT15]
MSFSSFFTTLIFILAFIGGVAYRGGLQKLVKLSIRKFNGIAVYRVASYFLSLLSLISLLVYIQEFGGFSSFIYNLDLNRAGLLSDDMVGKFAFVGRFIDLAFIPLIYYLYKKRKTKTELIFLLLIPLVVIIVSNLFISVSKLKFIGLGLIFYFTFSIKKNKLYLTYLFLFLAIVFLGLPILDEVFILAYRVFQSEGILAVPFRIASALLSGSLGQGQYETFLKDSSTNLYLKSVDYFVSGQISLQLSIERSYPLLFFRDFYTGISDLLPSRLNITTGLEVHRLNTSMYYDYYPEIPVLTWGVPPGIIAFGMYSLSVPGVMLTAFTLGYIFRVVDLFFKSIIEIDKGFSAFYAYTIFVLGSYSVSGMPKLVIYNLIILIFLFLFFFVTFKFRIKTSK